MFPVRNTLHSIAHIMWYGCMQLAMERMSATCATFVQSDIIRLSQRRQEILKELSHVDAAIQERTQTLSRIKAEISAAAKSKDVEGNRKAAGKLNIDTASEEDIDVDLKEEDVEEGLERKEKKKLSFLRKRRESEESYDGFVGPAALCAELRGQVPMMLFAVDRSDAEEVVAYLVPVEGTSDIVTAHRAVRVEGSLSVTRISAYEWMVAYGAKLVPNHEREDPSVLEMAAGSRPGTAVGELVGAIEVPCAPDVIIDVWRVDKDAPLVWATTSINGIAFCILERISLRSETHWGLSSVVEIALHGRHPLTDSAVEEIIDMNGGGGGEEED